MYECICIFVHGCVSVCICVYTDLYLCITFTYVRHVHICVQKYLYMLDIQGPLLQDGREQHLV